MKAFLEVLDGAFAGLIRYDLARLARFLSFLPFLPFLLIRAFLPSLRYLFDET